MESVIFGVFTGRKYCIFYEWVGGHRMQVGELSAPRGPGPRTGC